MRIGVARESKDREFRVGLIPSGARTLVAAGHEVLVERGAGIGSGFQDAAYAEAGASLVSREEAWSDPDLLVKVKEPNADEVGLLRAGQVLSGAGSASIELRVALARNELIGPVR